MKLFVIAKQEWSDKRMVWAAAFVAGLLCYALPGLLGYRELPLQDGRAIASLSVAFTLAGFMALISGAGMIAPDVQEGRFGFFLSRPVTAFQLFFGKWLGAVIVSLGAGLMVLLPTSLAYIGKELILPRLGPLLLIALLGSLVGHALSTALRARTIWLLLDTLTLLLLVAGATWCTWRLSAVNAMWEWAVLLVVTMVACTAGLGIVGWRQVALARTGLKGNHRVLSIGAMGVVAMLGLGGWLFVWNAVHVNAKTMGPSVLAQVARQGSWIHMETESWLPRIEGPKGDSNVLVNMETGRGIRTGSNTLMSANGNRAVWEVSNPLMEGGHEIWMAELGFVDAKVRGTGIRAPYFGGRSWLSADGRKLATAQDSSILVYDLDTGSLVARADSAHFMAAWRKILVFIGDDILRCYGSGSASDHNDDPMRISEMDLRSGRVRDTGQIYLPGEGWTAILDRNPSLDLMIVSKGNGKSRRIFLCDARTGAVKQDLAPEGGNPLFRAKFLSDGTIAMAGATGWGSGGYWAKHFDATGHEMVLLHLGAAPGQGIKRYISLGAETKPGVLVLRTTEAMDSKTPAHQDIEVDFKTSTVQEIPDQGWEPDWMDEDLLGPVAPGSLPTRLRVGMDGAVSIQDGDHFRQITKGRNGKGN